MSLGLLRSRRWRRLGETALVACCLLAFSGRSAHPAELTGFVSGGKPDELWGTGFGGSFGITLSNLVGLEFEGAWQGGQTAASDMWTASGRIYVGPTIQRFVPYAGISTGAYRQSLRSTSDTGTMSSVFAGLKFKLPMGLVLKAEYQWVHLPEEALVKMDDRYLVGAGLSF
jgi:hypothetical protein